MEYVSIEDAKKLCENGLLSQEELLAYMQIKAEAVKNIIANKQMEDRFSKLEADVDVIGGSKTSITMGRY